MNIIGLPGINRLVRDSAPVRVTGTPVTLVFSHAGASLPAGDWTRGLLSPQECRQLALNGMGFLDRRADVPADWRSRLVVRDLHIQSRTRCVLGQLFGSFEDGCASLGLTSSETVSYGFCIPEVPLTRMYKGYARLDLAWKTELRLAA